MDETMKNYPIYMQAYVNPTLNSLGYTKSISPPIGQLNDDSSGDSGHSSGSACSGSAHSASGNSSCDEIDVESIGSTDKLEKPHSSPFSISNLLKDTGKSTPTNTFHSMFTPLAFTAGFQPYDQTTLLRHWNPLLFPNPSFTTINEKIHQHNKLENIKKENTCDGHTGSSCSHTEDNSEHKCDICGKVFKHIRMLNRHRRNHSPYKKYKCNFCTKGFNDSFDLKRHVRTHTGVKPYKCNHCEKSFTQRCSLESHLDKIHGIKHKFTYKQRREKIYVCEDCGHSTHDVRKHYKHCREVHQRTVQSTAQFPSTSTLSSSSMEISHHSHESFSVSQLTVN